MAIAKFVVGLETNIVADCVFKIIDHIIQANEFYSKIVKKIKKIQSVINYIGKLHSY